MDYFIRHLKSNRKFLLISYKIYGLNFGILSLLCKYSGIHHLIRCKKISINSVAYSSLVESIQSIQHLIGDPMKRSIKLNIKNLIDSRIYRGTRHKHGYPSRGQRTRSNSKTKKRLFSAYISLYSNNNLFKRKKYNK